MFMRKKNFLNIFPQWAFCNIWKSFCAMWGCQITRCICCIPGTNMMLWVNYISMTEEQDSKLTWIIFLVFWFEETTSFVFSLDINNILCLRVYFLVLTDIILNILNLQVLSLKKKQHAYTMSLSATIKNCFIDDFLRLWLYALCIFKQYLLRMRCFLHYLLLSNKAHFKKSHAAFAQLPMYGL